MKKFALTSQGLRFNPGTKDFIYLTFWLNVCVTTVTAQRRMKKIAKGGNPHLRMKTNQMTLALWTFGPNLPKLAMTDVMHIL